jgi:hypothetical protein
MVRIFNFFNSCLQDVLEFTPTIDLNTRFCILSNLVVNTPPAPFKSIVQIFFHTYT